MAIDSEQLLKLVLTAGRPVGIQEVLRAGGFNPGEQTAVKRVLRELVKEGQLLRDGKRFRPNDQPVTQRSGPAWGGKAPEAVRKHAGVKPRAVKEEARPGKRPAAAAARPPPRASRGGKLVEGIIHHHRDGFAFVKPIVGQDSEDLFIPPDETRKTLDNDQVVVEVVPGNAGRTMGRVLEVTSRTRQLVVGTYNEDGRRAWVEPREAELGAIQVPLTQLARPGDVVKVRLGVGTSLFKGSDELVGEVAGSLGSEADHSIEVLSVAFAKGFQDEFPPEVMDEADRISLEVSDADARSEHRRDLRKMPLITIDGEDARDFDDAVFCEKHGNGWRLVVAIADVSHYVRQDAALDQEALRRATSVYLPSRVLPMLPERLSNGICSLKPDVDRLCMVADMQIDAAGITQASEFYPAVMRSAARCTYTEVHDVLAGKKVPGRTELKGLFDRLLTLSQTLTKMRLARGAIDFDLPEMKVQLKEDGLPDKLVSRERWESHRLVEECMLAANEAVARFFREKELPTVNRYHGQPDEDRLDMFLTLLGAYGITIPPGDFTSRSLNEVLKQLEGHPEQRALNQLALRSMMQAVYSSKNTGHYGLGAEDYLHFTSPIRRYPDLLVHRLLKELWGRGKKRPSEAQLEEETERLEALSVQCSERERAAMQVEREVNQLYSCLLVKDRLGEEHDGAVCGLSDNGFFVQLEGLWVEGFVKGESVFPDFEFDQSTYRMQFGNGLEVKVGMPCRVQIASVNMERKQIDFQVIGLQGEDVEVLEVEERRPSRGRGERAPSRAQAMRAVHERFDGPRGRAAGRFAKDERGGQRAASASRGGSRPGEPRGGGRFGREDRPGSRFGGEARGGGRAGKDDRPGSRFGAEGRGGGRAGAESGGGRFDKQARGTPQFGGGRFGKAEQGASRFGGGRFGSAARSSGGRVGAEERSSRYGGEKKYRSQDRGGRFGPPSREASPAARPTTPSPGRAKPVMETGDFGTTRRFGKPDEGTSRASRRLDGGPSHRERKQREREAPPPQPWDKKREEEAPSEPVAPKGGFDARAVLDRLWRERGGGKKR